MNRASVRTFYILLLTQTLSLIGSRMTGLAIAIKVFTDTEAVTPLALVAFFAVAPQIVGMSVAGVLADRWDRRWVMVVADAGQALGTLLLLLSFLSGAFALWHLYVISLIQAVFGVFQLPAFEASIAMLVPDAHRDRANAIKQITGPAAGLVAPVLAGVLFTVVGATGVMAIDLTTFLVAIAVVIVVHIPRPEVSVEGRAAQGTIWKEAAAGFGALWRRRGLFYLILFATLINFLFNMTGVMQTPYILTLTGSEALLGTLLALQSLGMLVGGAILSVYTIKGRRVPFILGSLVLMSAFLMLYGVARAPVVLGLAMFLMFLPNPIANALVMSIVQVKIPPDMQGRVMAAIMQLAMLATPLAFLIAGPLADHVLEPAVGTAGWSLVVPLVGSAPGAGLGLLAVINGGIVLVGTLLMYTLPVVRRLENDLPDHIPAVQTPQIPPSDDAPPVTTPAPA